MPEIQPCLEELTKLALPDGGWGYAPEQQAHLEPTCLALLALAGERERFQTAVDAGLRSLEANRCPDGSYRLARGRPEAVWPTALVLFTRTVLGTMFEELRPTELALLAVRGITVNDPVEADLQDIDIKLVGWPWGEGNFSWVEPTAWACLALRRGGHGSHPRVQEGLRLLLDRAFDEGGINYGNRRIYGRITEPVVGPTALMLLAVQGLSQPRIDAALNYLEKQATDDLEHLCWAKLALHVHGRETKWLDELILEAGKARGDVNWARPALVRTALTALALNAERQNPFQLSGPESTSSLPATIAPLAVPRKPLGERLRLAFQGLAIETANRLRPLMPPSPVHIAPVSDYNADLAGTLQRQYEAFRERVPLKGKRVVLKPNLVEYHRDKVINTHPHVVVAVIELCKREGAAEVLVAEGPGHRRNAEHLVQGSGLGDVLRHYRVPFVDLNHDEPVKLLNMGRATRLTHLYLSRTVVSADVLISLPKLKTHHWAGVTLSLKNLFGTLPGICYGWPKNELHWRGIENSIVDIALTRTPDLAIVDAIVGMEGDGPLNGSAKNLGALVMGSDPLAVDATCCRLMKLDPERIPYLIFGRQKKLGLLREAEIQQLGERIDALAQPFETLPKFHPLYCGRSA